MVYKLHPDQRAIVPTDAKELESALAAAAIAAGLSLSEVFPVVPVPCTSQEEAVRLETLAGSFLFSEHNNLL